VDRVVHVLTCEGDSDTEHRSEDRSEEQVQKCAGTDGLRGEDGAVDDPHGRVLDRRDDPSLLEPIGEEVVHGAQHLRLPREAKLLHSLLGDSLEIGLEPGQLRIEVVHLRVQTSEVAQCEVSKLVLDPSNLLGEVLDIRVGRQTLPQELGALCAEGVELAQKLPHTLVLE